MIPAWHCISVARRGQMQRGGDPDRKKISKPYLRFGSRLDHGDGPSGSSRYRSGLRMAGHHDIRHHAFPAPAEWGHTRRFGQTYR
jgi:hypothetical protein